MDIFSFWLGIALHTTRLDDPEISDLDNPIGIAQIDLNFSERAKAFCKHETSIRNNEVGFGLNECGLMYRIK